MSAHGVERPGSAASLSGPTAVAFSNGSRACATQPSRSTLNAPYAHTPEEGDPWAHGEGRRGSSRCPRSADCAQR